jgi:hypothetical protein
MLLALPSTTYSVNIVHVVWFFTATTLLHSLHTGIPHVQPLHESCPRPRAATCSIDNQANDNVSKQSRSCLLLAELINLFLLCRSACASSSSAAAASNKSLILKCSLSCDWTVPPQTPLQPRGYCKLVRVRTIFLVRACTLSLPSPSPSALSFLLLLLLANCCSSAVELLLCLLEP